MSARPVPVPETCSALYAVLTPEALDREDHLELPTVAMLKHNGTSEAAIKRFQAAKHQHVLSCEAAPEAMADALLDLRKTALTLAEKNKGIVVDLLSPRVLEYRADEVSLESAGQWFVLDYDRLDDGVLLTDGLERFGLPEVACRAVDREAHAMYSAVLTGLAHRLIAEWPTNDPVGRATVTLRDIAYGLGDAEASSTPNDRAIEVDIDYDPIDHLLVVTLDGDPASLLFAP
jgi:hypothetical protein